MQICEKSFYISNALDEIKTDDSWSTYEIKILILILQELSNYRVYVKKEKKGESIDSDAFKKELEVAPNVYKFYKKSIQEVTRISNANFARDIKKTCKSMMKKIIDTPNPLDINNTKSFKLFSWFTDAEYLEKQGLIKIKVHHEMIKRLAIFKNYTNFDYQVLFSLSNCYSLKIYMSCKIMLTRYKVNEKILLNLDYLKKKIGLQNKYTKPSLLDKYVLKKIKEEINDKTDINFNYRLIKEGRVFKKIELDFNFKKETYQNTFQKNQEETESIIKNQSLKSINFKLISYGISHDKSIELVQNYSELICEKSIAKLLSEIEKGTIIKNTAGYLIKCIENYDNNKTSIDIALAVNAEKEVKRKSMEEKNRRFNEFDKLISQNEQSILILLSRYHRNQKLLNNDEITMINSLKKTVFEYKDISKNTTPLTMIDTVGEISSLMTYQTISRLLNILEIASPQERIKFLKEEMENKKIELSHAQGEKKELLAKEISKLAMSISDLI